ncbi:MAG: class I SAM-dependent methyltransferase [Desulfovibrio sp.]
MLKGKTDWNEVWRSAQAAHRHGEDPKVWDKRAGDFKLIAEGSDYSRQFLEYMRPEPDWSVLDMGCAVGTLALPLARIVRRVTAADPSERMRALLRERCDEVGLENIRVADGSWTSSWDVPELGSHDVVLGSRSLIVEDLRAALAKAHRYARKKVFLSTLVGDGPHDRALIEAVGRTCLPRADYMVVVNLLREMGIFAEVRFILLERKSQYPDFDAAVEDARWMLREMSAEEEGRLRAYLSETLTPCDGGLCRPTPPSVRWALLSWDTRTGCDAPVLG